MSTLDLIVIGLILAFTLVSAAWGMVRQVIAVAGTVIAVILAGMYSSTVAGWLGFVPDKQVANGVAFVLIVIVISSIFSIIATVLYFTVGLLFLGIVDHMLGAFLGFVQGLIAVGILLVGGLLIFPDWMQQQLNSSFLASKLVDPLSSVALLVAPQDLKQTIQAIINR